jgi:alanine racemase
MTTSRMRARSQVVVDCDAISANTVAVKEFVKPARMMAVIKAQAYGHGAVETARAVIAGGADGLCVATPAEAAEVAKHVGPAIRIVVLGSTALDSWDDSVSKNIEPVAHAEREVRALARTTIRFHIELNTGLNRWGLALMPDDIPDNAIGVMTHFAYGHLDAQRTRTELARFLALIDGHGDHLLRHAASSGALLTDSSTHLDAVRCGQLLLGMTPPVAPVPSPLPLTPALRWTSQVAHTHRIRRGERVGYGGRFVAAEDVWIGVVPVGYADGLSTKLTGSSVLVAGRPAKIIGLVSMDSFSVVLSEPVPAGADVVIVGGELTLESHARHGGVGNVELAVGIAQARVRGRLRHLNSFASEPGVDRVRQLAAKR